MLIDAFGAILSAFLLGIVLVKFEWFFGIPKQSLYVLASIPVGFALYDFFSVFVVKNNLARFLKGIAVANALYCIVSLGYGIFHRELITIYGWIYIIVEISILLFMVVLEFKIANKE